jgi:hypothetical protein
MSRSELKKYVYTGVYNETPSFWRCSKNRQMVLFQVLPQELKFQPKFLGYLTGYLWGVPTVLFDMFVNN